MFRFTTKLRAFSNAQRRNISFADMKAKIEQTAVFQRVARPFNNPYIRRGLRAFQIGAISFLIYQAGYQRGIVSYSKDPEKYENEMMHWVLSSAGTVEFKVHQPGSTIHTRVNRITTRIIASARDLCQRKVAETKAQIEALKHRVKTEATSGLNSELREANATLEFWQNASAKMEIKWGIVVSDHDQPNAFVTGFCPRKIFVFEGLIKAVNPTDDELALILGHEISHVILGHTDESMPASAILLGAELVIMALVDPIGIWTFMFDMYLNKLREYITASYSRANEMDADELGIEVASNACFNVHNGAKVFKKLADLDKRTSTSWSDTHPASIERYERLTLISKKFEDNLTVGHCAELQNAGVLSGLYRVFGY